MTGLLFFFYVFTISHREWEKKRGVIKIWWANKRPLNQYSIFSVFIFNFVFAFAINATWESHELGQLFVGLTSTLNKTRCHRRGCWCSKAKSVEFKRLITVATIIIPPPNESRDSNLYRYISLLSTTVIIEPDYSPHLFQMLSIMSKSEQ